MKPIIVFESYQEKENFEKYLVEMWDTFSIEDDIYGTYRLPYELKHLQPDSHRVIEYQEAIKCREMFEQFKYKFRTNFD